MTRIFLLSFLLSSLSLEASLLQRTPQKGFGCYFEPTPDGVRGVLRANSFETYYLLQRSIDNLKTLHATFPDLAMHLPTIYPMQTVREGLRPQLMMENLPFSMRKLVLLHQKKHKPFPRSLLKAIMHQGMTFVNAMASAEKPMFHGDIKPDNLRLRIDSKSGEVTLVFIDSASLFALPKRQYITIKHRLHRGASAYYLPPEVKINGAEEKLIDPFASEIWSLGMTFLDWMAYNADLNSQDLDLIAKGGKLDLLQESLQDRWGKDLVLFVFKLLSKDPKIRLKNFNDYKKNRSRFWSDNNATIDLALFLEQTDAEEPIDETPQPSFLPECPYVPYVPKRLRFEESDVKPNPSPKTTAETIVVDQGYYED